MSKPRSRTIDYLVYILLRLLVCVVQSLSLKTATSLAHGLAWLAFRVDRRHRQVARENLRQAFPGRYSDPETDALVRAVYRHFCTLMVEIVHLPRKLHTNNWRRHLELEGGREIVSCLLSGRPLLIVTGHFGNWELAGYALGLLGFTTHAIARPLDNPYVDDFLRRFREATGQRILAKKGDFEQMTALLAQGGVIATLADQDAGQRGLFVDFFGRPASTHKAIALLALEYRVPLVVVGVQKVGEPLRYRIVVGDLIRPEEYTQQPDAIRAITQRFTTALEGIIRTAPEQYFWLHNRWKHQPAKARRKAA
jgi:KDO2-lipid IV(A) lauroyltransferase